MELNESQGDQLNTQCEESLICSVDEGLADTTERNNELTEQCEKSGLDEKLGEYEKNETQNYADSSQLLPVENPSDCDAVVQFDDKNAAVAAQDLVFNTQLSQDCHHLPNPLQGSPDHSEIFADIIKSVHELKCSNDKLENKLGENCVLIAELEFKCAALEKKNEGLEKVVAKLIVMGDSSATDLVRLSTEVTGLVAAKSSGSAMSDKKIEEQTSSDTDKQVSPNSIALQAVEQRIADLELLTVESSTRLKELAISVDHIERDLQRFIRRHSIIIENLCPKEDRSAQEAFLLFVNCVLHVSADESDIDGLHLIDKQIADTSASTESPGKTANDHLPRAILVTFTCYRTRMKVYKVVRCLFDRYKLKSCCGNNDQRRPSQNCVRWWSSVSLMYAQN
jgi:hypothetical protein